MSAGSQKIFQRLEEAQNQILLENFNPLVPDVH